MTAQKLIAGCKQKIKETAGNERSRKELGIGLVG